MDAQFTHMEPPFIGIAPERDTEGNLTGRYTLTVLGSKEFILDAIDHGNVERLIESIEEAA